jgi:hypothetical protein
MKLSEVKEVLSQLETLGFQLPTGEMVPDHFHVTEVGKINKHFIDCGGTVSNEEVVSFQLWEADDYDHRLHPEKLVHIIELSQKVLGIEDSLKVEVEYQGTTIGKYGLGFDDGHFLLITKMTDCLAKDQCGVPEKKPKVRLSQMTNEPCCSPDSNCC